MPIDKACKKVQQRIPHSAPHTWSGGPIDSPPVTYRCLGWNPDEENGQNPARGNPFTTCSKQYAHGAHSWPEWNEKLGKTIDCKCLGRDEDDDYEEDDKFGKDEIRVDGMKPLPDRVEDILTEAGDLFKRRNQDYRDADGFEPSEVLGIKGQFAEIWRKVWKLKNALWDGREMAGEKAEEILLDLIGHACLAIDMLRRRRDAD